MAWGAEESVDPVFGEDASCDRRQRALRADAPSRACGTGAIVLILPEKTAVCCSACGCAMTFLHATRLRSASYEGQARLHQRARPPPAAEPTP